jgi:hypothetical protein
LKKAREKSDKNENHSITHHNGTYLKNIAKIAVKMNEAAWDLQVFG